MADAKPKTVRVEALQEHTYNGKSYRVGDTYDIDEQFIETLRVQGKAVRVDRVAQAQAAEKAAEKATEKAGKKSVVSPMTTADMPVPKRTIRAK